MHYRKVTILDMKRGTELLCYEDTSSGGLKTWVGEILEVIDPTQNTHVYSVKIPTRRPNPHNVWHFTVLELNGLGSKIKCTPLNSLSDRDIFIYRMTGQMPCA